MIVRIVGYDSRIMPAFVPVTQNYRKMNQSARLWAILRTVYAYLSLVSTDLGRLLMVWKLY